MATLRQELPHALRVYGLRDKESGMAAHGTQARAMPGPSPAAWPASGEEAPPSPRIGPSAENHVCKTQHRLATLPLLARSYYPFGSIPRGIGQPAQERADSAGYAASKRTRRACSASAGYAAPFPKLRNCRRHKMTECHFSLYCSLRAK